MQDSSAEVKQTLDPATPTGETYPPVLVSSSARTGGKPLSFAIQRWHVALALVIVLCPLLGGLIHLFLPSSLSSFLATTVQLTANVQQSGSFYWSLFGRSDSCCEYVNHNDGYTLHYPAQPGVATEGCDKGMQEKVLEITRNAWKLRGVSPPWLPSGMTLDEVGVEDMPVIRCPQEALAVPVNATWTGGNGTITELT